MGLLDHIKVAGTVEVPHNHHPVVVQPPQVKREEYPFTGFIDFQGLKIDVENRKGDYRRGKDKDGHEWKCLMHTHYGEIRDTEGVDGDNLDVYVGPNHDASTVVVVRQHRPDTGAYDEDKVMVGFDSVEEAIGAYKKQYDKPGFYKDGDYLSMPIGQFWRWVHDTRKHGKKVAGVLEKVALSDELISRAGTQGLANRWKRLQAGSVTDHALIDRTMRQERVLGAEMQRRAAARAAAAAPAPTMDPTAAARSRALAASIPHPEAAAAAKARAAAQPAVTALATVPKPVPPPATGSILGRLGGLIAGNKGKLLLGAGALAAGGLALKAHSGKQTTPMPNQTPPKPTMQVASSPWAKQGSAEKVAVEHSPDPNISIGGALTGLTLGYGPGRAVAGHTAAGVAPHGYKTRSEDLARRLAIVAGPATGIAAMALGRHMGAGNRLVTEYLKHAPVGGLLMRPDQEVQIIRQATPALLGGLGTVAGGLGTGALVGGAARLHQDAYSLDKGASANLPDIARRNPFRAKPKVEFALHPKIKKALIGAGVVGAGVGAAKHVHSESKKEKETNRRSVSKGAIVGGTIGGGILAGVGAHTGHSFQQQAKKVQEATAGDAKWVTDFVQQMRQEGHSAEKIKKMLTSTPGISDRFKRAKIGLEAGQHAKKMSPKTLALALGGYGAAVGATRGALHAWMNPRIKKERGTRKTAEHVEAADPQVVVETMRPVLVCLLGLYHLYYFAHWSSRGEGAYGDHQLFERLYKSVQGEFDSVAERLVGHAGEGALDGVFTMAAAKNAYWMQGSGNDALHAALSGEAELQSVLHAAYQALDAGAGLTLGLDELIMGLASAHETNTYLLKQRAQPQVKAAALAPTAPAEAEPNKVVAGTVGGAGVLGGAAALHGAKPLVTGRETLYHGGGAAAAEEIRQGGLKTREQLGRMGGLTEGIAPAEVNEASKNLAFATDKKHIAGSYARQAGLAEEYMREHPGVDISKAYQATRDPTDIKRAIRLQMPFGTAGGSVAEMSVPLWKLRQEGKIVPNPEEAHHINMGGAVFDSMPDEAGFLRDILKKHHSQQISGALGEAGGTYAFKDGLGPEYVRGSKAFRGLTLREVGEYARTHPGRFAGGVGLGVLGATGVGLGLHHLYQNFAAQHPEQAKAAAAPLIGAAVQGATKLVTKSPLLMAASQGLGSGSVQGFAHQMAHHLGGVMAGASHPAVARVGGAVQKYSPTIGAALGGLVG